MKNLQPERRHRYRSMPAEEIIASMNDSEIRMNARRGGVMAIEELTRRGLTEV